MSPLLVRRGHLLPVSSHGRRGERPLGSRSQGTEPIHQAPPSQCKHLPPAAPPNTTISGGQDFNTWAGGAHKLQTAAVALAGSLLTDGLSPAGLPDRRLLLTSLWDAFLQDSCSHFIHWSPQSVFLCCSVTQWCPTLCDPMDCSTPGFRVHHQLLELAQTHVHWVGDVIQPSHPLSSSSPPAFNLSHNQGLLQWVSSLHQLAKYWNVQWIYSNEYSGLISYMTDWFDLLAVQGTLKSLLQHYSSKASVLWCSAFFIVQLSHPYVTTGKTIALNRWTFVGRVMPLLFNMCLYWSYLFFQGVRVF